MWQQRISRRSHCGSIHRRTSSQYLPREIERQRGDWKQPADAGRSSQKHLSPDLVQIPHPTATTTQRRWDVSLSVRRSDGLTFDGWSPKVDFEIRYLFRRRRRFGRSQRIIDENDELRTETQRSAAFQFQKEIGRNNAVEIKHGGLRIYVFLLLKWKVCSVRWKWWEACACSFCLVLTGFVFDGSARGPGFKVNLGYKLIFLLCKMREIWGYWVSTRFLDWRCGTDLSYNKLHG